MLIAVSRDSFQELMKVLYEQTREFKVDEYYVHNFVSNLLPLSMSKRWLPKYKRNIQVVKLYLWKRT